MRLVAVNAGRLLTYFACLTDPISNGMPERTRLAEIDKIAEPIIRDWSRLRAREAARQRTMERVARGRTDLFMVVGSDNLAREHVSEFVWLDKLFSLTDAHRICDRLNRGIDNSDTTYYKAVPQSYVLYKWEPC